MRGQFQAWSGRFVNFPYSTENIEQPPSRTSQQVAANPNSMNKTLPLWFMLAGVIAWGSPPKETPVFDREAYERAYQPAPAGPVDSSLRFGRAVVDITPPLDMPFHKPQRPPFTVVPAEGVHDPIQVKAMVFEDKGVRTALVACDLTSIPVHFIVDARKRIGEICTVPPENVMITATHVHTGPNIRPRNFQRANAAQKKVAMDYLERLPDRIAESVKAAEADLVKARLHAGIGRVEGVAFNRRFVMKNGTVMANPGKAYPPLVAEIVRPAGPTDPAMPLLFLDTPDGKPLATAINFALHLDTTGGLRYSADFPYTIGRILSAVKGPDMMTQFTYAAAGNINHYDLLDPQNPRRTKGYDEAARIGTLIAEEVVRSYQRLSPVVSTEIKVSREMVPLVLSQQVAASIAERHGHAEAFDDADNHYTLRNGRYTFEAEVMVITIGDEVALVGAPGELFVELGLAIKNGSPYPITFINSLANGSIGYVPDRKAQSEGAYGASIQSTRCEPGSGEALVESAIRQLLAHRARQPTLF